jgi:O-methyltransferase
VCLAVEKHPSSSGPFVRLRSETVSQRSDTGLVVVDLRTYRYLEFDEVGASMWEALRATPDIAAAAARLAGEYEAPADEIAADLAEFIEGLREAGLVDDGHDDRPALDDSSTEVDRVDQVDEVGRLRDHYLDVTARAICGLTAHRAGPDHVGQRLMGNPASLPPHGAVSLIGMQRLDHLRGLVERVISDEVRGDLVECGVWRGGASMMMKAVLVAHGVNDRAVWLADSFEGLPAADLDTYPLDAEWSQFAGMLAVSADDVRRNFEAFGLLDDSVRFLEGWFEDTLAGAPIERIAVLRLDGDLQASTRTALESLYHRVSPGGFVIIDDYSFESCRTAVDIFRQECGITADVHHIDAVSAFWQVPVA